MKDSITPSNNLLTAQLNKHAIWITWEIQVRNRSMANALNIPLHELIVHRPRFIKYPILIYKTIELIVKKKPKLIFAQNPSIVLSFLATLLKLPLQFRLIIDAHNAGVFPLDGKYKLLNKVIVFITRHVDLTIVTNAYLAEQVRKWGGKAFIMPDPIPQLANENLTTSKENHYVLFICTWAQDEPYDEVIKAASFITPSISIYITGNYKKKLTEEAIQNLPSNIKLLGFVPEHDYVNYFSQAQAAIDLTTRDNCLVCGGYEAISLEIPAIISDTEINREVFNKGFIYTKNNAEAIACAITTAISERDGLTKEIKKLKIDRDTLCASNVKELEGITNALLS